MHDPAIGPLEPIPKSISSSSPEAPPNLGITTFSTPSGTSIVHRTDSTSHPFIPAVGLSIENLTFSAQPTPPSGSFWGLFF